MTPGRVKYYHTATRDQPVRQTLEPDWWMLAQASAKARLAAGQEPVWEELNRQSFFPLNGRSWAGCGQAASGTCIA